jgi:hypothetical protein
MRCMITENKAFTPYWALPDCLCATAAVPTLGSARVTRVSVYPVFATETARRSGPPHYARTDAMSEGRDWECASALLQQATVCCAT